MRARCVVVLTILLAAAGAQAQPAPVPLLDVPYVSQSEALCGGAAAAMILRFWGERGVTAESFAPLVDRSAAGIRTSALIADLARRGWSASGIRGTDPLLTDELAKGRPVLALVENRPRVFHYVVVVGATPAAVIFHDPARAPLRVVSRAAWDRMWRATDRWMAIIVPARPQEGNTIAAPSSAVAGEPRSCDERVAAGVAAAQGNDLAGAEQALNAALSCPGSAALRELAGVRVLQRRWEDAAQLAEAATAIDPSDQYAWRVIGTSRYLLDQPLEALAAWNKVGEPRLDLIQVGGLERTRQRPVERLLGVPTGTVLSPHAFVRAERSLRELPSALSTRLSLAPVPNGLAELHATVAERPVVPRDIWSYVAIGATAAANRTASVTIGSITGGGEALALEWRFWPERPRVAVSYRAPAPWGGTWGADGFGETQGFDEQLPPSRRRGGRLTTARWASDSLRLEARVGADRWIGDRTRPAAGAAIVRLSEAERLVMRVGIDAWAGQLGFATMNASATATSARRTPGSSGFVPLGSVIVATAGAAAATRHTPADIWPAGDTGHARAVLLRAHPVLEDGRLRVGRLGRALVSASVEAQHWWKAPALTRVGAAVFVDYARTSARPAHAAPINDVDVGGGVRLAPLLLPGRIQLDVAHGLRDGANALTIRYVTAPW